MKIEINGEIFEFENLEIANELIKNDNLQDLDLGSVIEKYGNKFFQLMKIINKHDPMGFISMGAPKDEYDLEVKTIIVKLYRAKTILEVQKLVEAEFLNWFDISIHAGKLAIDIFKWKSKVNLD